MAEIGTAATVSLISSSTNVTVQTALSDSEGRFVLSFQSGFVPSTNEVYYLEAVKGLGNNKAGNSAARVRTMGRFVGHWATLSRGGIILTKGTTTLSAMASLLGSTAVPPMGLMEKLQAGVADTSIKPHTNDTFDASGTGLTNLQFHQVYGFVEQALTDDSDPMDRVTISGAAFALKSAAGQGVVVPAPTVFTVIPQKGPVGTIATVFGSDFSSVNSANTVFFNGVATTPLSSSATKVTVKVPAGATSGDLTVRTKSGTSSGLPFSVTEASPMTVIGGQLTAR